MKPKIFISHSAKTPRGSQVLEEICSALNGNDFEVLVDRIRLVEAVGQRWRDALNTWMELCHGAIAVIDESALNSGWVKQELAILNWRRDRDPNFILLPVVVPPVTFEALRNADLYPIGIGALQTLSAGNEYISPLVARCETLRTARADSGSVDRIETLLASLLNKFDRQLILQAARVLGEDLERWSPGVSEHRAFARLLLGAGLPEAVPALMSLGMKPADSEAVGALLATVWIDCRAVEALHRVSHGPAADRSVAINGDEPALSRWYVQRACGAVPGSARVQVRIGAAEDDIEGIVSQVRESLRLRGPPGISASRHLATLSGPNASQGGPIFLMFEAPEPDPDILDRLRQEFPAFTFFLLTGDHVPEPPIDRSRAGAYFLRPELRADDTTRALDAWSVAYQQLVASDPGT
ncbi:toll/interleukin-1 receptor domain-containing protein [Bradyrhizobium sp. th.b2]|uniref:toll/interleukin-1 receptor domain-containing protein n=1 Tax=Bradyrhizobium sp. th-b2 TaxID=172088 RepID=UPI000403FAD5|nr:toll/interleukin-1 receptor domain-containing protein [Bradyrhizobium sp. th.b2]